MGPCNLSLGDDDSQSLSSVEKNTMVHALQTLPKRQVIPQHKDIPLLCSSSELSCFTYNERQHVKLYSQDNKTTKISAYNDAATSKREFVENITFISESNQQLLAWKMRSIFKRN
ncbi:hypothetical protein I79_012164 [Cricetulus griseus]|uniref:Uncharacterized protein n=1 Tax=Cricetulus griseus TaxID=10029 RepID=G3HN33_CRIGR|nr:hypothetical protein I79_012164 [Cricetulus griseus]